MSNEQNQNQITDDAAGMGHGIEALAPLYLAPDFAERTFLIVSQKCYRVEIGAGRHYRNEGGETFKSITTFLDAVMPPNYFLKKWRESKIEELGTVEAATEFVQSTADFGTGLHIAVADFCRNGRVDWAAFEAWAFDYLTEMKMQGHTLYAAAEELTRDFAAIMAFLHDYDVRIIAVEIPVFSADGYATLIDLVVEMNALKYTEKTPVDKRQRIRAGINLKSGKKGFFESHVFQLIGERRAFNETYANAAGFELVEMFNLAPTDWLTEPNYKLKKQTEAMDVVEPQFDLFVKLGKQRGVLGVPRKTFTRFRGVTEYGASPVPNMVTMSYDTMTRTRMNGNVEVDTGSNAFVPIDTPSVDDVDAVLTFSPLATQ